jgi:hypothetical protein
MLGKVFFDSESFNPSPFWENTVLLDLTGASKYEADKIYPAGRYRIQVAPGNLWSSENALVFDNAINRMDFEETINEPFIIRAYCGGDGTSSDFGRNPYEGSFKVNGVAPNTRQNGIDVNHIFGAGGGNGYIPGYNSDAYTPGGGNCLGNGMSVVNTGGSARYYFNYGAGSCLHLLPVGGTFGVNYLRAYHVAAYAPVCGGAYGGGASAIDAEGGGDWFYRGGNSPYGAGGTPSSPEGKGIGGGGKIAFIDLGGGATLKTNMSAGAYYNGKIWIDHPSGILPGTGSSYIKITYLGGL